eukprot:CFRG5162T1
MPTKLYTWGPNSYGQLGLGHTDDVFTPQEVKECSNDDIILLTGGGGHTCVVKSDGNIEVCGWNNRGQLGLGHTNDIDHLLPSCASMVGVKWKDIACGWAHTIGLTESGHLYSWGCNRYGQLGLGDACQGENASTRTSRSSIAPQLSSIPQKIHFPSTSAHIKTVHSSENSSSHTTTILRDEKLDHKYSAHESEGMSKYASAECYDITDPVVSISAGLRHVCVCTRKGLVYVWGSGRQGQLGLGEGVTQLSTPTNVILPNDGRVICVAAGQYHTLVLTLDGRLYGFGSNKHGQISPTAKGTKHSSTFIYYPVLIEHVSGILPGHVPSSVGCGWSHSFAVFDTNVLFTWGRNSYGQLGHPLEIDVSSKNSKLTQTMTTFSRIPILSTVKQLSCGSEHSLAIIENDVCVSWGWNEHGPCGQGGTENIFSPTPVTPSFERNEQTVTGSKFQAVLIGAGYGHSLALFQMPE